MRIGMRLLLGYFLIVAIAAWFVLSIFVQEVKPGVRRATEGTLNDTATLLAALAREDLLAANPSRAGWRRPFTSSTSSRSTPILAELKRYVMSTASI
ncbi:Putative two-component sensor kinase [Klebsiella pneumoniae]|mgnify:FL=1|nr:two-component response regulator CreC [Klebsiella pneumoniae]SLQ69091.1 two-component response regulator CreC [Klebsiella pneumoniae]